MLGGDRSSVEPTVASTQLLELIPYLTQSLGLHRVETNCFVLWLGGVQYIFSCQSAWIYSKVKHITIYSGEIERLEETPPYCLKRFEISKSVGRPVKREQ